MPKVLSNLDLCKNEIQNVRLQNLPSPPENPVEGQEYYDTTLKVHRVYNGESWTTPGEGNVKSVSAVAPLQSGVRTGLSLQILVLGQPTAQAMILISTTRGGQQAW